MGGKAGAHDKFPVISPYIAEDRRLKQPDE